MVIKILTSTNIPDPVVNFERGIFPASWCEKDKLNYLLEKIEFLRSSNKHFASLYEQEKLDADKYRKIEKTVAATPGLQSEWENFLILVKLSS